MQAHPEQACKNIVCAGNKRPSSRYKDLRNKRYKDLQKLKTRQAEKTTNVKVVHHAERQEIPTD